MVNPRLDGVMSRRFCGRLKKSQAFSSETGMTWTVLKLYTLLIKGLTNEQTVLLKLRSAFPKPQPVQLTLPGCK
jgi:hypothetical protein